MKWLLSLVCVLALANCASPYQTASAQCVSGALGGAVAGGLLGSLVGAGTGNLVAIGTGAAAGTALGALALCPGEQLYQNASTGQKYIRGTDGLYYPVA